MTKQTVHYDDGTFDVLTHPLQYYRHKGDVEIKGRLRSCATPEGASPNTNGCPAVWTMLDEIQPLNKYWQFALCGWNPGIPPKSVMAELGGTRALANRLGYGMGKNLTNWPVGSNTDSPYDPAFDKVRTMSHSMLSGVAAPEGKLWFRDYRTDRMKMYTGYLIVDLFDGSKNPPMKPGKRQPETMSEVNFETYLYNPRDHWHLFFALNIVNFSGELVPFAGGATYPWFFEGKHPVCFMPHVSRKQVLYPLELLEELPLGTPRVRPYTK